MSPLWITIIVCSVVFASCDENTEQQDGTRMPTLCEVCKHFTVELKDRLDETGKTAEVLRSGHGLDANKQRKSVQYKKSELRFIESLHEPHICDRFLTYDVHKEKKGSFRYSRGRSETMQALHDLVKRGTKVDIGIPYELWDKPSVEITNLQKQCYQLVEEYEDDLEEWYLNLYDEGSSSNTHLALLDWFCRDRVLHKKDASCLHETDAQSVVKVDL